MTSNPLISIAIPAWGSSPYVADALKTIARTDSEQIEVIVSVDPGSPDRRETLELLRKIDDIPFRLVEPGEPLSMAGHYEWCLSQMRGRWVTILGADDGLLPWSLSLLRELLKVEPDADALMFRRCYYFWPGVEDLYGTTRVAASSTNVFHSIDGIQAVLGALKGHLKHFDLPQIYTNNFIRSDVIERIRGASGGQVFHERNPDVYSGVAVAHYATRIVRCEVPAFWTGTSPSSMGLKQRRAVIDNHPDAMTSVRADFVERSDAFGHSVAPEVGGELWLLAQKSEIYVLSAYLRFVSVTRGQGSVPTSRALLLAFAAALGRFEYTRRQGSSIFRRQQVRTLRSLLRRQASPNGIKWASVLLLAVPVWLSSRARTILSLAGRRAAPLFGLLHPRSTLGIIRISDLTPLNTLSVANDYVLSMQQTLLPVGIVLHKRRRVVRNLKDFINR